MVRGGCLRRVQLARGSGRRVCGMHGVAGCECCAGDCWFQHVLIVAVHCVQMRLIVWCEAAVRGRACAGLVLYRFSAL